MKSWVKNSLHIFYAKQSDETSRQVNSNIIDQKKEDDTSTALLSEQTIEGDSLKITVWDNLRMQVWKWQNGEWVHQIFGANSKGFKLFFDEDNMASYYSGNDPEFVSNTMPDDHTIVTVVRRNGVKITQTVQYRNGDNYYSIRWDISNEKDATIDSLKFFAGEDTYFAGSDQGVGFWDPNNYMVYVKNDQGGETGIMGFSSAFSTKASAYYEDNYSKLKSAVADGRLPNTVNPENHDAAYALGWVKNNLAPGQTWTLYAYETFRYVSTDNEAPSVTIISPNGGEAFTAGSTMSINWSATDNEGVTRIDIRISLDGGETYQVINNNLENSPPFVWTIPDTFVSNNCKVKIIAYDAAFNSSQDESDAVFSITKAPTQATISAEYGPPSVANEWQLFTIPLTADAFGVDAKTFQSVLANVTMFRIRTEMHDGPDVGGLDNVQIGDRYSSDFATGSQGWSAAGDGTMEWIPSGGVSNGYLQISDWATGDWHWAVAPVTFSGDWRELVGQNISFYFKTDHPSYSAVVEIYSGESKRLVLYAQPQNIPVGGSAVVTVSLSEAASENVVVSLNSSSSDCISVPENVTISAGNLSATFTATAVGTSGCSSVITASATGYGDSRITLNVEESSGQGSLTGYVTDATTGDGIAGATVTIATDATTGDGIAGATVTIAGITVTTDENGRYRIDSIPAGYHQTLMASAEGYSPFEMSIHIAAGSTTNYDISLSPTLSEGEFRLVLNWGQKPPDLDIHLITPQIEGVTYEVSWESKGWVTANFSGFPRSGVAP